MTEKKEGGKKKEKKKAKKKMINTKNVPKKAENRTSPSVSHCLYSNIYSVRPSVLYVIDNIKILSV